MKSMLCDCPFHDFSTGQLIVGYRKDLPIAGKPLRGAHGHVCMACAPLYAWRLVCVPRKYAFGIAEYFSWVLNPKSILLPDEIIAIHAPIGKQYPIVIIENVGHLRKAA
jgi:hypothetical protein